MSTGNRPRPSAAYHAALTTEVEPSAGLHPVAAALRTITHMLSEVFQLAFVAHRDRESSEHDLVSTLFEPWDAAEKVVRDAGIGCGIAFPVFDPLLKAARAKLDQLYSVAVGIKRAEFHENDAEFERIRERLRQLADSIPALTAGDNSPEYFLALLSVECPPRPPDPPLPRVEAAALYFCDELANTNGRGRECVGGQREIPLGSVPYLARDKYLSPESDPNVYRWVVRRLIETRLVTLPYAPGKNRVTLSLQLQSKRRGMPGPDPAAGLPPWVCQPNPPILFVRSTPELWERWRAGCMFPPPEKPLHAKKQAKGLKENAPPVVVVASELRRLEGLGISKPSEIIAYMLTPDGKALRSAVDDAKKAQPKKKRSGKPSSDSSIIAAAKQRNRRPNATS